jgi:phage portal protein BeeE
MLRGECFRIPIYEDSMSGGAGLASAARTAGTRRPLSVVFVDPAQMQHMVEDHELVGWRYIGSGKMSPLESQVFLPHEVWFEKLPNPFDFWRGLAPLYAATMPAQTDFAAASFKRGFIENNADLGLIVRTDNQLSEDQRTQVLAALRARKRRAGTADRPIVLSGGAQIIKPEISSADLQFLENRKFSRAEICAAFGVPEEIITATDHAKYDVMQGARLNFIENRVIPLCARLQAEEAVTVRAIDPSAVGWFDTDSLPIMQDARRNRLSTAKIGFDMGIPFNELNRIFDLGFKDLPWGDTGYVPGNLAPLGTLLPKP